MTALLDTGFLLAAIDKRDKLHKKCVAALETEREPFLPEIVLPELAYMISRGLGWKVLTDFLGSVVAGELPMVKTEIEDLGRAAEILEKYADAKVDFVDCVIVATAERLNIKRILTVDRRHFGLFRPRHCDAFEIVP